MRDDDHHVVIGRLLPDSPDITDDAAHIHAALERYRQVGVAGRCEVELTCANALRHFGAGVADFDLHVDAVLGEEALFNGYKDCEGANVADDPDLEVLGLGGNAAEDKRQSDKPRRYELDLSFHGSPPDIGLFFYWRHYRACKKLKQAGSPPVSHK